MAPFFGQGGEEEPLIDGSTAAYSVGHPSVSLRTEKTTERNAVAPALHTLHNSNIQYGIIIL